MKTLCVMMLALVGGIQAYWPRNGPAMTNNHNFGNHGMYGNSGYHGHQGNNAVHGNPANSGFHGNPTNSGFHGNSAISGHVNHGMSGIHGNFGSSDVQSNQGTVRNGFNPNDLLSILLMTQGKSAMNDPMVKSLAMMSLIGGEGGNANLTPQQIMALTRTSSGQGSNPETAALLAALTGINPGAALSPGAAAAAVAALSPGAALSTGGAGAAAASGAEPPEGGAGSRMLDLLLLSKLMPGFTM